MAKHPQLPLLLTLAAVWVGLITWQLLTRTEPDRVPLKNVAGQVIDPSSRADQSSMGLQVKVAKLTAISTQRAATFGRPRNIFAKPTGPGSEPSQDSPQPEAQTVSANADDIVKLRSTAELRMYRYLGLLRVAQGPYKNQSLAVMVKDEDVYVGAMGQSLNDQIRIKDVTPESVTLQHLRAQVDQVIPVLEDAPVQIE